MSTPRTVLGVIIGNRDFFPDKLVGEARADLVKLFAELGVDAVMLDPAETKLGGVETHGDARKCAELFRKNRDRISGVLVCLPNFGDEKGVADTLKLAGLNVPVLVQGYPDDLDRLDVIRRRDAFCGKISVCNTLRQAGIAYTLTTKHVVHPLDASFRAGAFAGRRPQYAPRHLVRTGLLFSRGPGLKAGLSGTFVGSSHADDTNTDQRRVPAHAVWDLTAEWRVPGSFIRQGYEPKDALQRKLADHCPVGVDLRPAP
jgi:hypothetical protein